MASERSHKIALQLLKEKRRRSLGDIERIKVEVAELDASISVLSGSSGDGGTSDYAELGLSDAASKYVEETPGQHAPADVLRAIKERGFTPPSASADSQIATVLSRLYTRGVIQKHAGNRGAIYSAKESATTLEEK